MPPVGETTGPDGADSGEPARIGADRGVETAFAGSSSGYGGAETLPDSGPSDLYAALAPSEETGEIGRLGPYGILGLLGSGGMKAVFRAVDPRLRRPVALKILKPALARDTAARKRFLREARAAAALEHDHVVAIYEVNEDRGVPYLVMPLLAGETLDDRLKAGGRLPIAEALKVGREAAEGLAAAHARGLIHRDIKPSNLWLESGRGRVKILDFGLARGGEGEATDDDRTDVGVILGTPAFMAPEQANAGAVDGRADLYSLGCVLYLMATGISPFRKATTLATLDALRYETPRSPRDLEAAVPPAFSELVMKLLEKDPADRPATATEVADALAKIEAGSPAPTPTPRVPRRRWRIAFAAALVGLVAIVASQFPRGGREVVEVARPTPTPTKAPDAVSAEPVARDFRELHGAEFAAYKAWIDRMRATGFRPTYLSAHNLGGVPRFAALAVREKGAVRWESRIDRDADSYVRTFRDLADRRYNLVAVCGFVEGQEVGFASIWAKNNGSPPWWSWVKLPMAGYRKKLDVRRLEGSRPRFLASYSLDGVPFFTPIFVRHETEDVVAMQGLTVEGARKLLDEARAKGQSPVAATAYMLGGEALFAIVTDADRPRRKWVVDLALTTAEYEREIPRRAGAGMSPKIVSGYEQGGQSRYFVLWTADRPDPLPTTGVAVPALGALDEAMLRYMAEREICGGTLAVTRGGKLVLSRGYGHADREQARLMAPDAPMRLASVTKLFTNAAIRSLIRRGKLTMDAKVAPLLDVRPPPGKDLDPHWAEITVGHLMDHRGGWDSKQAPDPMFQAAEVAEAVGKAGPPTPWDFITYMAGQHFQFAPGERSAYSNFGYCLLGRVVEKASGRSYVEYLRDEILAPLGIEGVKLGRTLPEDRDPREPSYLDPRSGPSVMGPRKTGMVPEPDGAFVLEAMDSHGGLVAPAPDVARFLAAYRVDGDPQADLPGTGGFFGSLPGTFTLAEQRADGVTLAVLFNGRPFPTIKDLEDLQDALDRAADSVKAWPSGDPPEPSPR